MRNENKLCWFCKHFSVYEAEAAYSEYTPGSDFSMSCDLNVWEFDEYRTNRDAFRIMLSTAKTCEDFDIRPELEEE